MMITITTFCFFFFCDHLQVIKSIAGRQKAVMAKVVLIIGQPLVEQRHRQLRQELQSRTAAKEVTTTRIVEQVLDVLTGDPGHFTATVMVRLHDAVRLRRRNSRLHRVL